MRKVNPAVGILLVMWTMFTVGCFVMAAIVYAQNRGATPINPGDPNIGLGMIYVAAMLNVPTILCWVGIMWVERGQHDPAD